MYKRYLLWILLLACVTLLPAIALNWLLLKNEGDIVAVSSTASTWQARTHGVTLSPTLGNNGLFKTLRLNDRLPEIDTVVFGASTAFTLDSGMLPPDWTLYNYAQSGEPLRDSIAQAEYLAQHAPQVRHYLIMMDWAINSVYEQGEPPVLDLSHPSLTSAQAARQNSWLARLQEAASYPRMSKLGLTLRSVAQSARPAATFRELFFQLGSDEYLCPDGKTPAMDFGVYNRGACNGFRYDGSATFADYGRIGAAAPLIISATASGSMYARALQGSRGEPSALLLARLAALDEMLRTQGKTLILVMPPLLPGLEQAFLHHPDYGPHLLHTRQSLKHWSDAHNIAWFDFGESERFGCQPGEFIDTHHATQECYGKIFAAFWQNARKPDGTPLISAQPAH